MSMATPKEAAVYLNVTVQSLAVWRCVGKGPVFHKFEGRIRYDLADLDAYKQRTRHRPIVRAEQERNVAV